MNNQRNKHWHLYILKLENNKWYVGITSKTPQGRFRQHKNGFLAAAWTKRYKPLRIHDTKDLGECTVEQAQLYEGRVTRTYMEKYGDNNVRGGDLTDDTKYIRRFGYFYCKNDWETLATVVLLLLILLVIWLDKYQWNLWAFLFICLIAILMLLVPKLYRRLFK